METKAVQASLVSGDQELCDFFEGLSLPFDLQWQPFHKGGDALESLFNAPPDLLIVDELLPDMTGKQLVEMVKSESVYQHLPVVFVLQAESLDSYDWTKIEIESFLVRNQPPLGPGARAEGIVEVPQLPLDPAEVAARLSLTLNRAGRSLDANPLTHLPGNATIIRYIQTAIDRGDHFALGYVDLDNFKAYNDKYGFTRGDEVLHMTARLLANTVRQVSPDSSFAGHIGGDDFVLMVPAQYAQEACERIIAGFDSIVPGFYDDEDRESEQIVAKDRKGNKQTFPLMAVSIAVIVNHHAKLKHYGEASKDVSSLKKKAKENPKSCFVMDQRQSVEGGNA